MNLLNGWLYVEQAIHAALLGNTFYLISWYYRSAYKIFANNPTRSVVVAFNTPSQQAYVNPATEQQY